jgi:MFS family permease
VSDCKHGSTFEQQTPRKAWAILAVVYFASIMAPLVQFKIPPLATWIFATFADVGFSDASFGLLMSTMALAGTVLAFPAAFITRRIGLKDTVLLSLSCLVLGNVLGAAIASLPMLMLGRVIEGIGIGLIGVAAPACVSVWFPEKTRGLALGIWATWVPVGIIVMFNLAPVVAGMAGDPALIIELEDIQGVILTGGTEALTDSRALGLAGYSTVYWSCAVLSAIAFVLFALVFKVPEGAKGDMGLEGTFLQSFRLFKNRNIWLLGIIFFMFCWCTLGVVNTFHGNFIMGPPLELSQRQASSTTSIIMVIALVVSPFAGMAFDKFPLRNKKYLVVAVLSVLLLSNCFGFNADPSLAYPFMIVMLVCQGVSGGATGGVCRPFAPLLMGGGAMGAVMGMALLQFMQNLGNAVSSPLFGALLGASGGNYYLCSIVMQAPALVIAIVAAFMLRPEGGAASPASAVAAPLAYTGKSSLAPGLKRTSE